MKNIYLSLSLTLVLLLSCTGIKKQEDNVLNVYCRGVIPGIDPMTVMDRYSHTATRQIYDGLYEYHYLKYPYTIHPVLADGMPKVKDNGLTYIIRLKKGVLFADDPCFQETGGKGREVTAHDFIYSLKRFFASSYTQNFFFSGILSEIIIGVEEFKKAALEKKDFNFENVIPGMKALDRYTLQFKLKKTSSYFPGILTRPNGFVVAKEAVKYYGADFKYHPVGSGAFKLQEWERGSKLVFVRNTNYKHGFYPSEGEPGDEERGFLKDAGRPVPFLDKVVMHILVEEQPRWLNFIRGKIDIVVPDKDSYYDAFPIGGKLSKHLVDRGVKMIKRQKLEVTFYVFNMFDKTIAKNKYLRQAISLAYDGSKHNALFFNNQALVANWIISPGLFGFNPSYKNPYRQHNIAKAKELMKKAGYPNGQGLPTLTMLILDSIAAKQIGEFFAKSVGEIGVKIHLEAKNFGLLIKDVNQAKGFQLATLQWRADLPFAEDFLRLLYGKAFSPGPNHSRFSNAKYDKLYEMVTKMRKGPEKLKLLNQMRNIGVENCPLIPLVNPVVISLTQSYVENYKPHLLVGDMYKYVRVDNKKRKKVQKLLQQ